MNVTIEENGAFDRTLTIELPAERVDALLEQEFRKISGQVRIPGFRPGKAPKKLIESRYMPEAASQVMQTLFQETYPQALQEKEISPVGQPKLDLGEVKKGTGFTYKAEVQIYPEIDPQGYTGIELNRPTVEVNDADVEGALEDMRTRQAEFKNDESRKAENGDQVLIDFEGFVDGVAFDGGKGENHPLDLGEGRFIPGFEEELIGVSAGDDKEVNVTFPEKYHSDDLAGKAAVFKCKVHEVRVKVLPELDEEFAKKVGVTEGGVEELTAKVREGLEAEASSEGDKEVKQQIFKAILAANKTELPSQLVDQEIDRMVKIAQEDYKKQGIDPAQVGLTPEAMAPMYQEQAKDRLILGMVMGEIGKKEGIEVTDEALDARLDEIAAQIGQVDAVKSFYKSNPEHMEQLRGDVMEKAIIDWIVAKGKVTDETISLTDLKKRQAEKSESDA